ncbi:MAG: divergent polysaccharide deacetylase family protein [Defluviitaleaceae bacterium]|nr:divergent polysaccharide deacetylase family protein [Defluviitaleaceae bacterium]
MKTLTLNGPKTMLNIFTAICLLTLVYFGFIHNSGALPVSGEPVSTSYLAVIINGFGNGAEGTREFMYLDVPFTAAVLPGGTYTGDESRQLLANGKEVIIHMPMEARNMRNISLPEISIMDSNTKAEARAALLKAIDQIPGATGINNHLGTQVMTNEELVTTILSTVQEHNLYFVDSLTGNNSKALEIAENLGTQVYIADILLDGRNDIRRIERNLRRAGEQADENGFAIVIGHVGENGGKATVQAIQNMYNELSQKGVVFVTMSELIERLR